MMAKSSSAPAEASNSAAHFTPQTKPAGSTTYATPFEVLSHALISQAAPSFNAWHIAEPRLIFAGSQLCEDPKTGLTIYGPAALDSGPRNTIRLGVIGSGEMIPGIEELGESCPDEDTARIEPSGQAL